MWYLDFLPLVILARGGDSETERERRGCSQKCYRGKQKKFTDVLLEIVKKKIMSVNKEFKQSNKKVD